MKSVETPKNTGVALPEVAPHSFGAGCQSSPARRYLERATSTIFRTRVAKAIAAVTMATTKIAIDVVIEITSFSAARLRLSPRRRVLFRQADGRLARFFALHHKKSAVRVLLIAPLRPSGGQSRPSMSMPPP
jgi:hypothetical protein